MLSHGLDVEWMLMAIYRWTWLVASFAMSVFCGCAAAQEAGSVRSLAPSTWLLSGTSGNVVIIGDRDGLVLIDSQGAGEADELAQALSNLPTQKVSYVVNTHWHLDHAGGNAAFGRAGAQIVAHRAVRSRLGSDQYMPAYDARIPASPASALPTITFDQELDLWMSGQHLRLIHTTAAHTDGDVLVYASPANVLHMGDIYFNGYVPFLDIASGGSLQGLIAAVAVALEISDDSTIVIPAHGPIATVSELAAYHAMLVALRDTLLLGLANGLSVEEVQAAKPMADYPLEGDADAFVAAAYASLSVSTSQLP
jgi:glyoxylase-like metal-dependent hydrolase (beta-lactamase superfamily II)